MSPPVYEKKALLFLSASPLTAMPPKRKSPKKNELLFLKKHPFIRQTVLDRIYGCIIGSALGDTIGLYTEFLTKAESARIYPSRRFQLTEPLTEPHPDGHRSGYIPLDGIFNDPHASSLQDATDTNYFQHVLRHAPGRTIQTKPCSSSCPTCTTIRMPLLVRLGNRLSNPTFMRTLSFPPTSQSVSEYGSTRAYSH